MSKKQTQMMILLQDLMLAFVINTTATILEGGLRGPGDYLVGMFMAFSINYVAGLILPAEKIGAAAARALRRKEGTLGWKLVRIFVINAIFVTVISFTIALIRLGPVPGLVAAWWKTYPVLHIVGYVVSVLIERPVMDLAKTIVTDLPNHEKELTK